MKVLVNDGLQIDAIKKIEGLGFEVVNKHYNNDILGIKLKEFDVLVVRSATKVTSDIINEVDGGKLKLIIRAGVGIDNIDVEMAKKKGIVVRNTPNSSSESVAELALGHMFAVSRFISEATSTMRQGKWNKDKYEGVELSGKVLGIIGMGRIGKLLADKANALGMNVIYNDSEGELNNSRYDFFELNDLLRLSDFISIHVPCNENSAYLIGEKQFDIMKDNVFIINCARGKVIDEKALIQALENGKVAGAGIDVFEQEPTNNEKLINHPRVSCTPHIGAVTKEAQNRIAIEVVEIIKEFFNIS